MNFRIKRKDTIKHDDFVVLRDFFTTSCNASFRKHYYWYQCSDCKNKCSFFIINCFYSALLGIAAQGGVLFNFSFHWNCRALVTMKLEGASPLERSTTLITGDLAPNAMDTSHMIHQYGPVVTWLQTEWADHLQ